MYDLHGTEQEYSHMFNPNDIDPNQIFRMFFGGAGGDPFANLFNGGGGSFTVYSNLGGTRTYRTGGGTRQRQAQPNFGGSIFDVLNELNNVGNAQRRRQGQRQQQDEDDDDGDVFNIFQHQRQQRGRNNRQPKVMKTPVETIIVNLLNQCLP